jgi:diguanylate cyclase (GGDEF)-like protein
MATAGSDQIAGGTHRFDDAAPFHPDGLLRRLAPFALVLIAGEIGLALSPGHTAVPAAVLSATLLVAAGALVACTPWERAPSWLAALVPLLALGSVSALARDAGSTESGITVLALVPVLWTGLRHRARHALVVLGGVFMLEVARSLSPDAVSGGALLRRCVLWTAVAALIVAVTHELRGRLAALDGQRASLLAARERALTEMGHSFAELARQERESALLGELAGTLHACSAAEETFAVIEHAAEQLFPGGTLAIFHATRRQLDAVVAWGPADPGPVLFSPEDCWALRRGRIHAWSERRLGCPHARSDGGRAALCVPMAAHGEVVGVFHIYGDSGFDGDGGPELTPAQVQLALAFADQVGMALANFRLRETLRNESIRDPLTNLYNRRYMEETLQRELARAARHDQSLAICQLDIDYFKTFNDTYGHDAGDGLLAEFGRLLAEQFRDVDVPCRYGGEEFTVILGGATAEQAERRAVVLQERLRWLEWSGEIAVPAASLAPTVSIGVAAFPDHGSDVRTLMRAADQALYAAKAAGRNRVVRAPDLPAGDSRARLGR